MKAADEPRAPRRRSHRLPTAQRARPLAALLTAGLLAGAVPADEFDAPTRAWRSGPVRYLLTGSEDQAFKALATDAERAAFIRAFWARRDPTPATRRNEFRERFADRVRATEGLRRYQEQSRAQWMTDLGKYLILLGPPISEEHSQVADSTRDTVIWTYDSVPGVRERNFSIAFVADESGELRLSESPSLDMTTTQGLAPHTPTEFFQLPGFRGQDAGSPLSAGDSSTDNSGGAQGAGVGGPGRDLTTMYRATAMGGASTYAQIAQMQALMGPSVGNTPVFLPFAGAGAFGGDPLLSARGAPTSSTDLGRLVGLAGVLVPGGAPPRTEVEVKTSFEPVQVDLRSDFYAAADGTTYAAFTLAPGAASPAEAGWIPFGGMVSLEREEVAFSFSGGDQFAPAGAAAPGVFQTGLGVDPGRYRALFGLQDGRTGRFGYRQVDLSVPDFSRGLAISSLTLARSIEPAGGDPHATPWKVPYVLGTLRVVPRPDATFRNGEEFNLYYQVYGAAKGPEGRPDLAMTYRFAAKVGDEWQEVGKPIEQSGSGEAQAWSFPLRGWPPGSFRLTVEVRDRIGGRVARGEAVFSVAE